MIPGLAVLDGFTRADPEECWPWQGHVGSQGYGSCAGPINSPHRAVYQLLVGPIPKGLVLDHLCHTLDLECPGGPPCLHRRCVNPSHLEPVTNSENSRRGSTAINLRPRPPRAKPTRSAPPARPVPASLIYMMPDEVAERLGVTKDVLARWRKKRCGPGWFSLNGSRGHIRYHPDDVEEYDRRAREAA